MLNKVNSNYSTGSNSVNLISNSNMETDSSWIKSAWGGSNTFLMKSILHHSIILEQNLLQFLYQNMKEHQEEECIRISATQF